MIIRAAIHTHIEAVLMNHSIGWAELISGEVNANLLSAFRQIQQAGVLFEPCMLVAYTALPLSRVRYLLSLVNIPNYAY